MSLTHLRLYSMSEELKEDLNVQWVRYIHEQVSPHCLCSAEKTRYKLYFYENNVDAVITHYDKDDDCRHYLITSMCSKPKCKFDHRNCLEKMIENKEVRTIKYIVYFLFNIQEIRNATLYNKYYINLLKFRAMYYQNQEQWDLSVDNFQVALNHSRDNQCVKNAFTSFCKAYLENSIKQQNHFHIIKAYDLSLKYNIALTNDMNSKHFYKYMYIKSLCSMKNRTLWHARSWDVITNVENEWKDISINDNKLLKEKGGWYSYLLDNKSQETDYYYMYRKKCLFKYFDYIYYDMKVDYNQQYFETEIVHSKGTSFRRSLDKCAV